ncbi:lipase family protein [Gordonia paraffinivorans]|uniref:Secretory lipase n=1 Tax=Gordonia paraffinivorans TaxID=175628 RepID=A0ABD7UZ26_9ACTN|nr:lipase family protein [Gordonia paraffinivorans]MCD2144592.1 lipase family protein [Gordonia paraffinivorans]VFA81647.1 Secretory lipase [Gordonia paraffinivorans]
MLVAVAASVLGTGPGSADPWDAFYKPPQKFDTRPGSLIRSAPSYAAVIPYTGANIDARTTTVMYTSTGARNRPTPVTGSVLVPRQPWKGKGDRPLVVVGSGTIGAGDQCAPSRLLRYGQAYEEMAIGVLLANGYAVAMTDYEGLGTPGDHPYLNRRSLGTSMIDMARVARNPRFGVSATAPVAFWGYSEGGFAAGSAAELAASYAPELPVFAAFAGAPAPDLADLARLGDGSLLGGGVGWVVNGFIAAYPQHRDAFLSVFNQLGRSVLRDVNSYCVFDVMRMLPFVPTTFYTKDGRPIRAYLDKEPFRTAVDEQRLGRVAPKMPVLVSQNRGDDVVDPLGTDRMVRSWRAKGADVTVETQHLPLFLPGTFFGHGIGMVGELRALSWLNEKAAALGR